VIQMAKHQDTLEDWMVTGGPAVDHVLDAAKELSKRTGMTFMESVETIIETVYQRIEGTMPEKTEKELCEILETLTMQGFIEWPLKEGVPKDVKELLWCLHELGVVDRPREVSGSFGAILVSEAKAEALKRILRWLE